MNTNAWVALLTAHIGAIADMHAQDPAEPRLCAAGCPGAWPCPTRRMADLEGSLSDGDAPSGVVSSPQTAENASGVPTGGSGRSEANQAPLVECGHTCDRCGASFTPTLSLCPTHAHHREDAP